MCVCVCVCVCRAAKKLKCRNEEMDERTLPDTVTEDEETIFKKPKGPRVSPLSILSYNSINSTCAVVQTATFTMLWKYQYLLWSMCNSKQTTTILYIYLKVLSTYTSVTLNVYSQKTLSLWYKLYTCIHNQVVFLLHMYSKCNGLYTCAGN